MENEMYEILGKHFRNEISPDEKQILDHWLQSEENKIIYSEVEKTIKLSADAGHFVQPDVNMEWTRFNQLLTDRSPLAYLEEKKSNKIITFKTWGLRIAAVLLIGLSVIAAFKFINTATDPKNIIAISTTNELKEVALPDGSTVTLNKKTTIQYPAVFSGKDRQVSLSGEAYFEVVKGKGTFVVNTGNTTITVLGTKFNVKASSEFEKTELFVTEGKVKFRSVKADNSEIFTEGEHGIINNNTGDLTHEKIEDPNNIAWKTGNLIFNNSKISDVQDVISEYFGKTVIVDPELDELTFTGKFNNAQLNEILEVISVSLEIKCLEKNDSVLIQKLN